jgi:hypothetical protein
MSPWYYLHHVPLPIHTSTHQFILSLLSLVVCHTLLVVEGRGWLHYSHSHNWEKTGNTDDFNYHPQQVIMTDTGNIMYSTHQFTFSLQSLADCHILLAVERWPHYSQQVIMTDTAKMYTSSFISTGNYCSQPLVFTPHCQYLLPLPTTWHTLSGILTDSCFSLLPSSSLPFVVLASILSLV